MVFPASLPADLQKTRPVQVLAAALQKGRLAHAILLQGDSLEALEMVALSLTSTLLKTEAPPLQHPDLFTLRPAKKARMIRIGERGSEEPNTMRKMLRDLQQTSNQGGWKVAIVYEADRMNAATANAFLKTLEEPPADTILLLLTTRPYQLLDTIRSRCFNFRLPLSINNVKDPEWDAWLTTYKKWLQSLAESTHRSTSSQAETILGLYGLVAHFEQQLSKLAGDAWKSEKDTLSENMTEEEVSAYEVGVRKGIRNRLLMEIEEATRMYAIESSHRVPFPCAALNRAIPELENVTGLLEVNLKEEVALEHFLLQSLRIWTRHE